jgi:SAM-dependent methyltransferase
LRLKYGVQKHYKLEDLRNERIKMKTIKTFDMKDKKFIEETYELVTSQEFISSLIGDHGMYSPEKYDTEFRQWLENKLLNQVLPFYEVLDGNLEEKRILDLGCGSRGRTYESTQMGDDKIWEPWLCRALYSLGASPIGIDVGDLEGEKFEHKNLDLLSIDSLSFLDDDSIDVAHADLLFDSPELGRRRGYHTLRGLLIPQLERVVKPNGFFLEGI